MALGALARDITLLVVGEAAALAALGAAGGVLLGVVFYLGGLTLLAEYQHFPFAAPGLRFMCLTALALTAGFTGLSAAAAWLSSRSLNHLEPGAVMLKGEFD
jgi:ABC-type antimicrobial peptide transport system permease subunit